MAILKECVLTCYGKHGAKTCHPWRLLFSALFQIALLSSLCCCFDVSLAWASQTNKPKRVLILNSYHPDHEWTADLLQGELAKIKAGSPKSELLIEFLDSKRFPNTDRLPLMQRALNQKLAYFRPDLILTNDNAAFDFAVKHRNRLFPGKPIVFAGYNGFSELNNRLPEKTTGVAETINPLATIKTALKLHPKTRQVLVVIDSTPSGKETKLEVSRQLEPIRHLVEITFLDHLNMGQILDRLKNAPQDSIVLALYYNRDNNGKFYSHIEAAQIITKASSVPVYFAYSFALGHGGIGGYLLDGKAHGAEAGALAVRVLRGEKVSNMPPIPFSNCPPQFDHAQLVRWNIDESELPQGSLILNKPNSFYQMYKSLIWFVIAAFVVLVAVIIALIVNIAARHKAQKELITERQRLANIVDGTDVGTWEWNVQTGETLFNERWASMIGYTLKELQPITIDTWMDKTHPEDLEKAKVALTEHFEGRSDYYECELRMQHKNGDWVWMLDKGKVAEWTNDGKPRLMFGTHQDITKRRMAEAELEATKSTLETAIAQSPAGILIADAPDVSIRLANPAALGLRGGDYRMLTDIEVDRHSVNWQTFKPDGSPYPPEELPLSRAVLRGEETRDEEVIIRNEAGEDRWVSVNSAPILNRDGNITSGIVVFHDVTQRKLAEKALIESEERYRQIFEDSPAALFMQDYSEAKLKMDELVESGVADLRSYLERNPDELKNLLGKVNIIFVNQAAVDLYKAQSKDDLLRSMEDFTPPAKSQHYIDQLVELYSGKGHYKGYGQNKTLAGKIVELQIKKVVVAGHEKDLSRVVAAVVDLTEINKARNEKEKLESQLRQAQKLEAIGTLAGGIAHDFNNILSAIMGFGELGQQAAINGKDNRRYLDQIVEAADRAANLVKQILAFSRRSEIEHKRVNLNQLLTDSMEVLERTIPKMINMKMNLSDNLDEINADYIQLEQVVLNLAGNASDAMPDGGELIFETSNAFVDQDFAERSPGLQTGKYVLMTVTDTGHGMDKTTLGKIFDPFYTTKEVGKGTGLGLSTAYGVIKEHEGHIFCYSEPGLGTTFKIYLPSSEQASQRFEIKQPLDEIALGDNETILLVDDEEDIREVGQKLLIEAGYQVITASSGEEALDVYRSNSEKIDLVVLDLSMPGMGGHIALREILSINPAAKVLIVSGYSANGKARTTIQEGACGFIPKPFRRTELLQFVRRALDN